LENSGNIENEPMSHLFTDETFEREKRAYFVQFMIYKGV